MRKSRLEYSQRINNKTEAQIIVAREVRQMVNKISRLRLIIGLIGNSITAV